MIHNEAPAIVEALSAISGVANVTRGWPRGFAQLPVIAVTKAADTPTEFADDEEYLTELEYYIRIFTRDAAQADDLAQAVDEAMRALRFTRTFSYDSDESDVRMNVLRYRKYV